MDPTCKFKHWMLEEDGGQCKAPYCEIGFFECQWIDNCIPCPLRWQYADWDGWDDITPEIAIKIVDNAKTVVEALATFHRIDTKPVNTLFDLLDATRQVQSSMTGTQTTDQTLESIAATLKKLATSAGVVEHINEKLDQ